jgi:hypothetical protein
MIIDERDLHERLTTAFEAISPRPAPVDDAIRDGRTIRVRRRAARAAVVAGAGLVAAAVAVGVPSLLRSSAIRAPASPSSAYSVTVRTPGPGAQPGEIASGTINGQPWWVLADRPGIDGAGAGQQNVIIAGSGVGAIGGTVLTVPMLSTAGSLGPVSFVATDTGAAQIQVGVVQPDVSYVTVRLADGRVLILHPVTVYGTRAVAFASPMDAPITDVVAYSRQGELGYAVPFNQPGGFAWFASWLQPGQRQAARASRRIASARVDGAVWSVNAYVGPWGTCVTFTAPHTETSPVGCIPAMPGTTAVLNLAQGGGPEIAVGIAAPSVTRLVVTQPDGSTLQVRPATVGYQKVIVFGVRPGAKPLRWTAYGRAGKVVASSARR